MPDDANETIELLREKLRVQSDAQLARKLSIDKSTISSWRARNSVPQRYRSILDGVANTAVGTPAQQWGETEQAAFGLAIFWTCLAMRQEVENRDYIKTLEAFSHFGSFWMLMEEAQKRIATAQGEDDLPLHTAQAMIIHETLENPEKVISDIREVIVL